MKLKDNTTLKPKRSKIKWVIFGMLILLILLAGLFIVFSSDTPQPVSQDTAISSTKKVEIDKKPCAVLQSEFPSIRCSEDSGREAEELAKTVDLNQALLNKPSASYQQIMMFANNRDSEAYFKDLINGVENKNLSEVFNLKTTLWTVVKDIQILPAPVTKCEGIDSGKYPDIATACRISKDLERFQKLPQRTFQALPFIDQADLDAAKILRLTFIDTVADSSKIKTFDGLCEIATGRFLIRVMAQAIDNEIEREFVSQFSDFFNKVQETLACKK